MAVLPDYLKDQTEETIMQRMLNQLPADIDKAEGSYIWDSLAPTAVELAQSAIWAREVLRRGFASSSFGSYLDLRCEEHGITRKLAVKAQGEMKFTGAVGAVVPAGTRVSTPADATTGEPSVEFLTKTTITLDSTGVGYVNIEAAEGGKRGNVSAGAILILVSPLSGVFSVINMKETSGGLDTEDDASLQQRFLQRVRTPSAGGNKADYLNWVTEVPGVGGAAIIPVDEGPGTVGIYVVDTFKKPASLATVEQVQQYISPPYSLLEEENVMTLGGSGVSLDTSQSDSRNGSSLLMEYNSSGMGTLQRTQLDKVLPRQAGVWRVRPHVKVSSTAGTASLVQCGIWNSSKGAWAKISPTSTVDAVTTKSASDLLSFFKYSGSNDPIADAREWPVGVDFYWNGEDHLELCINRLQNDNTTKLWVDNVAYLSTFSKDTGDGKAPLGVKVMVHSAVEVRINISVTLNTVQGSNVSAIQNEIIQGFEKYITSLSLKENNDVLYTRLGQIILDTQGVQDYNNLIVNGTSTNVLIDTKEVAVLGDVVIL